MPTRYLPYVVIALLTGMTFLLFYIRVQPLEIPLKESPVTPGSQTLPVVTFIDPVKGDVNAQIQLVVFSDFQCEACALLASTLDTLLQTYRTKIQVVWKDLPNESLHTQAVNASMAAHCAQRQDAFWPYHDQLFIRQSFLNESQYTQIAQQLELNVKKFDACYASGETRALVEKNMQEAVQLGITATPTIYIGSTPLVGAQTFEQLAESIEQALKQQP